MVMVITLIGMSGAGKSAVAEHLAQLIGGSAVDVDKIIEKEEGELLEFTLERLGEDGFLARESHAARTLPVMPPLVIATGGSIVLSPDAMEHLKNKTTIVYLRAKFETINARIGKGDHRGIVGLARKTLQEIYDERLSLYEQFADTTTDVDEGTAEEIAERIYCALNL